MKKFVYGFMVVVGLLAVFACASGGGSRGNRGLVVEELPPIEVYPQVGHTETDPYPSGGCVVFSPDGKRFATSFDDNTIILWDTETCRELRTFLGHSNSITSIDFSPDGKYLVSGSADESVKLWDTATGREIKTLCYHPDNYVGSVAFSPDGKTIVSCSSDADTMKLWNVAAGMENRIFSGHSRIAISESFSPNGKIIASGSDDNSVKLWDAVTGRELKTFSGHTKSIYSVSFSPDGKTLASCSWDRTVKLWDVATGAEIRTFSDNSDMIYRVFFSSDGKYLIPLYWASVKLWDIATGEEKMAFPKSTSINYTSVKLSPDGKRIAISFDNNTIILWDIETCSELRTFLGHSRYITSVDFSPDGKYLISNSSDRIIKLWDVATGREIRTITSNRTSLNSVALSPDKKFFVSGVNNTLELWNVNTGLKTRTFTGHSAQIFAVAFSPDGKTIASGSDDKTVKLWDAATGMELMTFSDYPRGVYSVSFSPDGKYLASGSFGVEKIWDLVTGGEAGTFTGHSWKITSLAFSPDGKYLASCSNDNTIIIRNAATGKEINNYGHSVAFGTMAGGRDSQINSIAFSPDGKYLASGSYDNRNNSSLMLLDVVTGEVINTFSDHFIEVLSVAFSPDGKYLVSGYADTTIKLWNAATGREIRNLSGHSKPVSTVAFSADGKHIISSGMDSSVRLWDASTGKELAAFVSLSGSDSQLTGGSRGTRDISVEVEDAASSIDGEWVVITPDGYYAASPLGDRYLNVRIGNTVTGIDSFRSVFYNPDVVRARLAGKPDPASKATVTIQQAARFMPPDIALEAHTRSVNSPHANISVSIADKNLPIQNVIVMVNGRRLGADELSAVSGSSGLQPNRASLSVTGNQQTLNLTLPVNLDPGDNRVEVVAFNGYSENRRYIDMVWDAPAGAAAAPPDLWILAIGVNQYDNAGEGLDGLHSLNYCVADARGVIDSLAGQEGRRYGKVHSLLVADDAQTQPTAEQIRRSLRFLEGAGPRDVVLLFLAGHGVSAQGGQFYFLPRDAAVAGDGTIDASRAISGDEIVSVLDGPGNRLVFIDACQSGGVDNDRMVRKLMDTNAFVFAACRGNESSLELPSLGHGVFTYSVMDALKGTAQAAQAAGNISVISMSGFVSLDVPERTAMRQHPAAYSLGFYDFPVAVIK